MKKVMGIISLLVLCSLQALSQKKSCGNELLHAALVAKHPEYAKIFQNIQQRQTQITNNYLLQKTAGTAEKAAPVYAMPVIFHIILDTAQISQIGGVSGIEARVDSQIAVLNRDYGGYNADSANIPIGFKALFGHAGVQFGLAHMDPNGNYTPGYELITTTSSGFYYNDTSGFPDAKHTATGGADQWDMQKYINVWVINPLGVNIIGLTLPRSYVDSGLGVKDEMGIVINYGAFGVQSDPSQYYVSGANMGRTLTHEMGHYFELWHTWGDDAGLCPWNGGADDGIADTPPQGGPDYGCPTYPRYDACNSSGAGVMFVNYLDYSDDDCMHMLTIDQAARVRANGLATTGESYSLTQHPEILGIVTNASNITQDNELNVYPNPARDKINIYFNQSQHTINAITVINTLGQQIYRQNIVGQHNGIYTIDIGNMPRGIYFVQCTFASGTVIKKIVLQ